MSDAARASAALRARAGASRPFFDAHAADIAHASEALAARMRDGGRLLAFGRGAWATDAQHVSVEFVHPVIVGKRALPAMDLSATFEHAVGQLARRVDAALGFGAHADPLVARTLQQARARGVLTFAWPGADADLTLPPAVDDPCAIQELIEVAYHTLWETVHVFLEHGERGHDVGRAAFLYPYLGREKQDTAALHADVAASIRDKAAEVDRLRELVAAASGEAIVRAAQLIRDRTAAGGAVLLIGNGGSATDANDFAHDLTVSPWGRAARRGVALAAEPAVITAVANDIGAEAVFLRPLIAHAGPDDVVVVISTSGNSRNVVLAVEEARRRGLPTVALLGQDGGDLVRRALIDVPIVVPSDYIPRIQEVHASIYHVILDLLD